MGKWEEKPEIKALFERVSSKAHLSKKERIAQFWREYSQAIRPGLEEDDRFRARSMALSFTKFVI